ERHPKIPRPEHLRQSPAIRTGCRVVCRMRAQIALPVSSAPGRRKLDLLEQETIDAGNELAGDVALHRQRSSAGELRRRSACGLGADRSLEHTEQQLRENEDPRSRATRQVELSHQRTTRNVTRVDSKWRALRPEEGQLPTGFRVPAR